jgi:hypothetical protein
VRDPQKSIALDAVAPHRQQRHRSTGISIGL